MAVDAGKEIKFFEDENHYFDGDKYNGLLLVILDASGYQLVQLALKRQIQLDYYKIDG